MPYLVVLVVDQEDMLQDVMDAWKAAGVGGMTLMQSSGLGRVEGFDVDLPLMPSLRSMFESSLDTHTTIWAVVPDDFDIDGLFDATEAVTGNLDTPNSGLIFSIPVTKARGLNRWPDGG